MARNPKLRSGAHVAPRIILSIENAEQKARWEDAARKDGRTLSGWLRWVADRAAAKAARA